MNHLLRVLVAVFALSQMSGCGYKQIPYTANLIASPTASQKVIAQLLREETPASELLQDVDVNQDYVKLSFVETRTTKNLFINKSVATVTYSKFVYFNNIKRVTLYNKKSLWTVSLTDKIGEELYEFKTYQEEKAKAFTDAVISLAKLDPSVVSTK
jgi:hypothetical protein